MTSGRKYTSMELNREEQRTLTNKQIKEYIASNREQITGDFFNDLPEFF